MVVIKTKDGKRYYGETAGATVMAMCDDGVLTFGKNLEEYMRSVARRCFLLDRASVAVTSPEAFLEDLDRIGVIKVEGVE